MEKCRICLGNKKSLMCIFDCSKKVSFADMIRSISNIKIVEHDGVTNKICRSCRKSLEQAYDLKLLIESSDAALNKNMINFNNINEIKVKVEMDIDSKKSIKKHVDIEEKLKHGEVHYSNTIIKKIEDSSSDVCLKPIPVLEFLKTIKDEQDDDNYSINSLQDYDMNCSGVDSDNDGDYVPRYQLLDSIAKRHKRKRRQTQLNKSLEEPDNNNEVKDTEHNEMDPITDDEYIPLQKLLNPGKKRGGYRKRIIRTFNEVNIKPVQMKDLKLIYERTAVRPRKKIPVKSDAKYSTICPYCGLSMKNLKSHLLTHTGERNHKCEECNKAFYTEPQLKAHKHYHASKDFKCDECIAAFPTKIALKSHKITHQAEKKQECDICKKSFKRRGTLRRHRLMHNSANKTVTCDLCNMSFFSKFGLQHHLRIHTGERPYKCERYTLLRHRLLHNSANKNVSCDLCNMSFFTKVSLRAHFRIHTGERPYKCEMCSQPYSYKHDFNRHCLKKHGVYFKRREVYVMNEEVLEKERILMRDLMLRVQGVIKDDLVNPFEGPRAALAFTDVIRALRANQIPIALQ